MSLSFNKLSQWVIANEFLLFWFHWNAAPSLGLKMLSNKKRTPISSRCSPPTVQSWHSNLMLMKANVQHVHTVIIDHQIDHPNCSKPSSLTWSRVSYPASEEFMAGLLLLVPLCPQKNMEMYNQVLTVVDTSMTLWSKHFNKFHLAGCHPNFCWSMGRRSQFQPKCQNLIDPQWPSHVDP